MSFSDILPWNLVLLCRPHYLWRCCGEVTLSFHGHVVEPNNQHWWSGNWNYQWFHRTTILKKMVGFAPPCAWLIGVSNCWLVNCVLWLAFFFGFTAWCRSIMQFNWMSCKVVLLLLLLTTFAGFICNYIQNHLSFFCKEARFSGWERRLFASKQASTCRGVSRRWVTQKTFRTHKYTTRNDGQTFDL